MRGFKCTKYCLYCLLCSVITLHPLPAGDASRKHLQVLVMHKLTRQCQKQNTGVSLPNQNRTEAFLNVRYKHVVFLCKAKKQISQSLQKCGVLRVLVPVGFYSGQWVFETNTVKPKAQSNSRFEVSCVTTGRKFSMSMSALISRSRSGSPPKHPRRQDKKIFSRVPRRLQNLLRLCSMAMLVQTFSS